MFKHRNDIAESAGGLVWRKSRASSGADTSCVEAATTSEVVLVRDSKNRAGGILGFSWDGWSTFLRRVDDEQTDTH